MNRHMRPSSGRWLRYLTHSLMSATLAIVLATPATIAQPAPATAIRPVRLVSVMQDLQQSNQRWIQVDLKRQRLIAWEGDIPVYAVLISTGKASTPTPTGNFAVQTRLRVTRMQGEDYDVSNVPYTMYFYGGYAIHGAYWHHRFGTPVSHGCVNVAVNHARWLYNWASVGTPVLVHR